MKKILLTIMLTLLLQSGVNADSNFGYVHTTNGYSGDTNQFAYMLVDQLTDNRNFVDARRSAIIITPFVSIDSLTSKSRLSRILNETLITEMQVRGYEVIDISTANLCKSKKTSDFMSNCNVKKLEKKYNANYALVGNYAEDKRGLVLNARIISLKTNLVVSSANLVVDGYYEEGYYLNRLRYGDDYYYNGYYDLHPYYGVNHDRYYNKQYYNTFSRRGIRAR